MIHQWNFPKYFLSLLHFPIRNLLCGGQSLCIWVGFWGAWVTPPQVLSSASTLSPPLGWPLWFLVPGLSYVLVYFLWKPRSSKAGNAHSLDLSSSNVVIRGTKAIGMYYHGECHCLLTYVGSAVSLGFMSLCWLFTAWRSASCAALTDRKCACLPSCPPSEEKRGELTASLWEVFLKFCQNSFLAI